VRTEEDGLGPDSAEGVQFERLTSRRPSERMPQSALFFVE
jgi:hypothetical protein